MRLNSRSRNMKGEACQELERSIAMKRPISVTVIAWIMIAMGAISLITSTASLSNPMAREFMSQSPLPIALQYVMMYAGLAIMIVSGIALLRKQNWARYLYTIWSVVAFVTGVLTSPMKMALIPGFVIFLIIVFFLFRPKTTRYFTGADRPV